MVGRICLFVRMFQSLFLWILLFNFVTGDDKRFPQMFQSLFLWILLFNLWIGKGKHFIYSFNPCFYGFFFSIFCAGIPRFMALLFQSLFLWILLFNFNAFVGMEKGKGVSILVFMDSSFQSHNSAAIIKLYQGFNPCFYGFFFSICRKLRPWGMKSFVSILLFMDSSFQLTGYCCAPARRKVSILVFMDSSFQSGWHTGLLLDQLCFNPCFYGFFFSIMITMMLKILSAAFQSLFLWILLFNPDPPYKVPLRS